METATAYIDGGAWLDEVDFALDQALRPTVCPIDEWVELHIVCPPSSPHKGKLYRHDRHPASLPWFRSLRERKWKRTAATAPSQNGKTFMCYTLPILWHLFERNASVVVGLPNMDMANDKYSDDFRPAIEASFPHLLPTAGEGSKGGKVKSGIRFAHGPELRFMAGGGDDKQRAGKPAEVLAITETDGMDTPAAASREGSKISQLEARLLARQMSGKWWEYLECTTSIEDGCIWQAVTNGTNSRLFRPCPLCGESISPEREHLHGWQEADSEDEAGELAYFVCPECRGRLDEAERQESWKHVQMVHAGQTLIGGDVVGDPPRVKTLGFRWSAFDNPFMTIAKLGEQEWNTKRSATPDSAERVTRQFFWAIPYEPPDIELLHLDAADVQKRTAGSVDLKKGVIPDGCLGVSVGIDVANRRLDWDAKAIMPDGAHVFEHGEKPTESRKIGNRAGLLRAFAELKTYFDGGWADAAGKRFVPAQVWIDTGYPDHQEPAYQFCRDVAEADGIRQGCEIWRPMKGHGEMQRSMTRYTEPQKLGGNTIYIGRGFYMSWIPSEGLALVHVNSDCWKSELHNGLAMDRGEPGAVTLYVPSSKLEHEKFGKQTTAEHQVEEFVEGRGSLFVWRLKPGQRANHKLDAGYISLCAGEFIRVETEAWKAAQQTTSEPQQSPQLTTSDGRAFLVTER